LGRGVRKKTELRFHFDERGVSVRFAGESPAVEPGGNQDVFSLGPVIDSIPVPVLVSLDRECRTVVGNWKAFETLLVATAPGNPPGHYRIQRDGLDVPEADLPMHTAARTGCSVTNYSCEFKVEGAAARQMLCHAVPLLDDSGRARGSVATFADVTGLRRLEGPLWESPKLEGLDLIAGHTAKEFLTALASVIRQSTGD
jgi:hypothetical protein